MTTKNDLPFEQVWCVDFEFVSKPGERPDVVCLAARELWTGQTIQVWREDHEDLGSSPPYAIGTDALFVSYVANAECACHLALSWPLPARVLDLSPEFRSITNGRLVPEGKGLLGALAYYGLSNRNAQLKEAMQKRIMRGRPFTPEERRQILDYCLDDADDLVRLLPKMLPHIDLGVALYRGESVACLALIDHRGPPIDMVNFPSLADTRAWGAMRDAMVPAVDAQYGVYIRGADGEWHLSIERLEAYLKREGLLDNWPRTETGKLDLKRKT